MDIRFAERVEEFMKYVAELGLDHVEFKREYLSGHPDTPDAATIGSLADAHDLSVTFHAPFRDWNVGSYDETVRRDSVRRVKATLDDAVTAGAEAVVLHGGSIPRRYPDWVTAQARANARRSLAEIAEYADFVGVPIALENQPLSDEKRRYTTSPTDLRELIDSIDVPPSALQVTLDVGHAKVSGHNWSAFVDEFGDRIRVCHLHANDGTGDQHEPIPDHDHLIEAIPADVFVFEMKSVADVARSAGLDPEVYSPPRGGEPPATPPAQ